MQSLYYSIYSDFKNRSKIAKPTLIETLLGWICRDKKYKRFRKLFNRGREKVKHEMDILTLLQNQKMQMIEVWSLLRRNQH